MSNVNTLKSILVFDIETVSISPNYESLPERFQNLWTKKSKQFNKEVSFEKLKEHSAISYKEKAGIFAEYGKVVCICVGVFLVENNELNEIRVKSFYGKSEKDVLMNFFGLLNSHFNDPKLHYLAGHNIREFDMPFLCRRALINGVGLPRLFQIQGKRPWQVDYLYDTMDMWRFGDYKNYTSLDLLAATFDIPSPKDDIDGSMVGDIYWDQNDLSRIITYCEKDVVTSCMVLMKLLQIPFNENFEVSFANRIDEE